MRNKVLLSVIIASVAVGALILSAWLLTSNSTVNPQLSLYTEITPPRSNTDANISFLIRGTIASGQILNSSNYTLTNTPQGTRVQFHLHFNSVNTYGITISLLPMNSTSSPYPQVFSIIPTAIIQAQSLTVYIEYSAQGQWLFGTLPLYRDAYLYGPGIDSPVHFSTTGTILLVYSLLAGSALPVSAVILAEIIPEWRRELFAFFPWVTFTLSFTMIWGFIFIGNPSDYERAFGIIPDIFSTIPHFTLEHLGGNLTRGILISGVLLESWVGYAEQRLFLPRAQLVASMILMDVGSGLVSLLGSVFSIGFLQIGGFGASYTAEVWATLLLIIVLTRQQTLQRTNLLYRLYPLLAGISGFALLNYVYEWFLAGYVLGGGGETVILATNHIIAFFLGLLIIGLFYALAYVWKRVGSRNVSPVVRPASLWVIEWLEVEDYGAIRNLRL